VVRNFDNGFALSQRLVLGDLHRRGVELPKEIAVSTHQHQVLDLPSPWEASNSLFASGYCTLMMSESRRFVALARCHYQQRSVVAQVEFKV
jgi:hypothetical protein